MRANRKCEIRDFPLILAIIFENRFLLLPHFFLYFILCLCINFTSLSLTSFRDEISAAVEESEDFYLLPLCTALYFKRKSFRVFFCCHALPVSVLLLANRFLFLRTTALFAIRVATRTKCKICLPCALNLY